MESFLKPVDELGRGSGPAHHDLLQARCVEASPSLDNSVSALRHHRHQGHVGGALLLESVRKTKRGFKTANHHLLTSSHGCGLCRTPAVGVKQRNGMQIYAAVFESAW